MIVSDVDRAIAKATTLWAVVITCTQRKETWREGPDDVLHIATTTDVETIEWCLDEAHADRRVSELRKKRPEYVAKVRKFEMRYAQALAPGIAHELCELMSVAWAERADKTKSDRGER